MSLRLFRRTRNKGSLVLILLFLPVTFLQFAAYLHYPLFLAQLTAEVGLSRYTVERILFLLPIIWAGFSFGWRGGTLTSIAAVCIMLPRALFGSPVPEDALVETGAVFVVGTLASYSLESLRTERKRRAQLETAQEELRLQLKIIEANQKRLTALNQISTISSQSLDLAEILNRTIECIMDVMADDAVLIYTTEENTSGMVLAVHRGVSAEFIHQSGRMEICPEFSRNALSKGEIIPLNDLYQNSNFKPEAVEKENIKSELVAPLMSKGSAIGIVLVAGHNPRLFFPEERELLSAIANQLGVALENARLYQHERQVAEQLRISEKRYRNVFENAHDAILIHDMDGSILAANRACEKLTGYLLPELSGLNVSQLLTPEFLRTAREVKRKMLEGEEIYQPYEQHVTRKNGSTGILKMSTSLLTTGDDVIGFQHVARDVTEEVHLQENLHFLLLQITRAQEEERKRIALELHDDTIQTMVVHGQQIYDLACNVSSLSREEITSRLDELRQQNNITIQELRRLSQDLRPAALDRFGLLPALNRLASDMEEKLKVPTKVAVIGKERRLPTEVELVLFRIVQEAMRNIVKHAQATAAETTIEFTEDKTRVTIKDNGKGFDTKLAMDRLRSGKLGLAGMQERAKMLGGTLLVASEPGKGTILVAELPL